MLTDISPSVSVAGQFYGSQIQTMGITNIAQHIQKPVSKIYFLFIENWKLLNARQRCRDNHLKHCVMNIFWRCWIKEWKKGSESNDLFNNKKHNLSVYGWKKRGISEIWCQILFLSSSKCQSPADLLWSIKISCSEYLFFCG